MEYDPFWGDGDEPNDKATISTDRWDRHESRSTFWLGFALVAAVAALFGLVVGIWVVSA